MIDKVISKIGTVMNKLSTRDIFRRMVYQRWGRHRMMERLNVMTLWEMMLLQVRRRNELMMNLKRRRVGWRV